MVVYIVDDDEVARQSLAFALKAANISSRGFSSPSEFLAEWGDCTPGCLVVDYQMPEMSGLEMISELRRQGSAVPFILATGHGTTPLAIQALRLGAVNIIEKPFHPQELVAVIESIRRTIEVSQACLQAERERQEVSQRLLTLTSRESEVMALVVKGKLTKQIAKDLGISPKTVEVHRSNITKKLGVQSVAQLVNLVVGSQVHATSWAPSM